MTSARDPAPDGSRGEKGGAHALLRIPLVYTWTQRLFVALSGDVIVEATVQALGNLDGKSVLEIGCGTGGMVARFPGARYVGTDVNESYLRSCRQRLGGEYLAMRAGRIDLPAASIDSAFSVGVFHHLGDDEVRASCEEMARVLRPGASLVVADGTWPFSRWNALGCLVRRADRGRHMRSRRRLEELVAESSGLHLVASRPVSGRLLDYVVISLVRDLRAA